jgi:hypothetical protein
MALYLLSLKARIFHEAIHPALSASWRQRSFEPCRSLCISLLPAVESFAQRYHTGAEEPLIVQVNPGLPFDRVFWRALVGEVLWYSADEIPEFQTAPETLGALLAPGAPVVGDVPRDQFTPIHQAHFGARDLVFAGGFYRPDHAGFNDTDDVARLASYLAGVDPDLWTVADLRGIAELADDEERSEELQFVREWFPSLQDFYRQASAQGQLIVGEVL